jgi:hypothetical protein
MALAMVRPTKHPKTGIYRIRMAVPEALRPAAKELFGSGRELIENLRTKDPREARAAAASAVAKLEQKFAAIRAAHDGRPPELPEQAVQALAGKYYQAQMDRWGADPGPVAKWEGEQFGILDGADMGPVDERLPMDEDNRELKPVAGETDRQAAIEQLRLSTPVKPVLVASRRSVSFPWVASRMVFISAPPWLRRYHSGRRRLS